MKVIKSTFELVLLWDSPKRRKPTRVRRKRYFEKSTKNRALEFRKRSGDIFVGQRVVIKRGRFANLVGKIIGIDNKIVIVIIDGNKLTLRRRDIRAIEP